MSAGRVGSGTRIVEYDHKLGRWNSGR
jgi:hypothetical protein